MAQDRNNRLPDEEKQRYLKRIEEFARWGYGGMLLHRRNISQYVLDELAREGLTIILDKGWFRDNVSIVWNKRLRIKNYSGYSDGY